MSERVKKHVLFNFQLEKLNLTPNNVLGGNQIALITRLSESN